MDKIRVTGKKKLFGKLSIQGSKNSSLPILSACMLCRGKSVIHNCPDISDVDAAIDILKLFGCEVERENDVLTVDSTHIEFCEIPDDIMREMRSSIVFLGAVVSQFKKADMFYPGGCELGPRPIDIHLWALRKMGVSIHEEFGRLICRAKDDLKGTEINLPMPSVGATENIILAAVTAKGKTVIRNAAREPEIVDFVNFLNKCGASICGAGESSITITGVNQLHSAEHTVIPDRIVAATYMSAVAITSGKALFSNICPEHIYSLMTPFTRSGCNIAFKGTEMFFESPNILKSLGTVCTGVYPGFPTDAQPVLMATSVFANSTSVFVENIFENRFRHAFEMARFGAKIDVVGRTAVVTGKERLTGAGVQATDLRSGAALCVAALGCEGVSIIEQIQHIKRGYSDIVADLKTLNADIDYI